MRELEESNQDLINCGEEIDEANQETVSFRWDRKSHKFKIMSSNGEADCLKRPNYYTAVTTLMVWQD
ncbi:hypothetical protein NSMS1_01350 [Nostoc sp. MS1]|nr:hypothetical protein NSMS1_01350 [Nostoc sp. MS1]